MAHTKPGVQKGRNSGQVNRTLEEELKASLVDGKLPCAQAFKVAKKLKVAPSEVGNAADKLGIRIVACQLGCFP